MHFKVVWGLFEKMQISFSEIEKLIPFATIATVGDVMDLVDENRILVKEGFKAHPEHG